MSYWKIAAYSVASAVAGGAIGAVAVHCVRLYCSSSDRTPGGSSSFTAALQATDSPASISVDPAPMEDDEPPEGSGSELAESTTLDTHAAATAHQQRSDDVNNALNDKSPHRKTGVLSADVNRVDVANLGAFDTGRSGSGYIDDEKGGDNAGSEGESPCQPTSFQRGWTPLETAPKSVQLVAARSAAVPDTAAVTVAAEQCDASLPPRATALEPSQSSGREIVASTPKATALEDCDALDVGGSSASCLDLEASSFLQPSIERRRAWCSKVDRAPTRLDSREEVIVGGELDVESWPATVSPPPSPSSQCSGASAVAESVIASRCRTESEGKLCAVALRVAQQLPPTSQKDKPRIAAAEECGASAEDVTQATAAERAAPTPRTATRPADWAMWSRRPQAAGDTADRPLGASVYPDLDRLQSVAARIYIASIEADEAAAVAAAADSGHSISGENRRNRGINTCNIGSNSDSSSGSAVVNSGASNGTSASLGSGRGNDDDDVDASEGADWEALQRPEEEEQEEQPVEDCPEGSPCLHSYSRNELALAIGTSIGRGLLSVTDDLWQHIQDCGIGRPAEELPSWSTHKGDPNRKRDDQSRRSRRNAVAAAAPGEDWLDGTEKVKDAAAAKQTLLSHTAAPYEVPGFKSKQAMTSKQACGGDEWRVGGSPAQPAAPEPATRGRLQQRIGGFFSPEYEYEYAKLIDDLLETDVEYPSHPPAASALSTAAAMRGPLRQCATTVEAANDFRAYGDDEPDAGRFIAVEGSTNYYKIELSDAGHRAAVMIPAATAPTATSTDMAHSASSYYWQATAENSSYRSMLSGEPAAFAASVGFGGGGSSIGDCSSLGDVEDEVDAAYPAHHAPRTGSSRGGGRVFPVADDQQDAKRWNKQNGVGNRNRRPRRSQGEASAPPLSGAGRAAIRHKMDPAGSLYREAQAAAVAAVAKHVAWDPSVRTDDDDDIGWGSVGRTRGAGSKQATYRC